MKERPILFNGGMVRAIMEGRKTQTRRVIKPQPPEYAKYPVLDQDCNLVFFEGQELSYQDRAFPEDNGPIKCPFGKPGDRIWVRETWRPCECQICNAQFGHGKPPAHEAEYRADGSDPHGWRPSIFMPRWASRITLEITNVRVERVQDISEDDAKSEGIPLVNSAYGLPKFQLWTGKSHAVHETAKVVYMYLWESINGKKYPWNANPWVWVIEFEVLSR